MKVKPGQLWCVENDCTANTLDDLTIPLPQGTLYFVTEVSKRKIQVLVDGQLCEWTENCMSQDALVGLCK